MTWRQVSTSLTTLQGRCQARRQPEKYAGGEVFGPPYVQVEHFCVRGDPKRPVEQTSDATAVVPPGPAWLPGLCAAPAGSSSHVPQEWARGPRRARLQSQKLSSTCIVVANLCPVGRASGVATSTSEAVRFVTLVLAGCLDRYRHESCRRTPLHDTGPAWRARSQSIRFAEPCPRSRRSS